RISTAVDLVAARSWTRFSISDATMADGAGSTKLGTLKSLIANSQVTRTAADRRSAGTSSDSARWVAAPVELAALSSATGCVLMTAASHGPRSTAYASALPPQ